MHSARQSRVIKDLFFENCRYRKLLSGAARFVRKSAYMTVHISFVFRIVLFCAHFEKQRWSLEDDYNSNVYGVRAFVDQSSDDANIVVQIMVGKDKAGVYLQRLSPKTFDTSGKVDRVREMKQKIEQFETNGTEPIICTPWNVILSYDLGSVLGVSLQQKA